MSDRVIVRRITETKVIVRQTAAGPRVIVRNVGPKGLDGDPGDSAYAVAVANGFAGSEQDWLDSLVGEDGDPGPGVATGGTAGQFLRKQSGTNYDAAWAVPATSEVTGLDAAQATQDGRLTALESAPPPATALDDLTDVTITAPANGQAVIRRAGVFVNDAIAEGDVTGLVTALGLKADQTALDSEETDRITGDATLQAELDALPTSGLTPIFLKPTLWNWAAGKVSEKWASTLAKAVALYGLLEGTGDTKELVSGATYPLDGATSWSTVEGIVGITPDLVGFPALAVPPVLGGYPTDVSAVLTYDSHTSPPAAPAEFQVAYGEAGNSNNDYTTIQFINGWWDASDPGVQRVLFDVWAQDPLDADNWEYFEAVGTLPANAFDGKQHVVRFDRYNEDDGKIFFDGVDITGPSKDPAFAGGQYAEAGASFSFAAKTSARISSESTPFKGRILGLNLYTPSLGPVEGPAVDADVFGQLRPIVPAGGTTGQILTKASGDDFAAGWATPDVTQAELDSEATTRATDDATNATAIATEATARASADALKAPLASPPLTGIPTAPTAALGTNTTQLATMAAIKAAIDALVAGAPGALDTLLEISNQLATDESAVAALVTTVSGKQASHANLTAFAALTLIADRLPYANGSGTLALATLSAFIRTLLDDADAATAIATLGAVATGDSRLSDTRTPTDGTVTTAKIVDANVTDAKLADMPAATLKGRALGAGTGVPGNLTASQVRTLAALVIGTDVQAFSSILTALVAFTSIADGETVKRSGSSYVGWTPSAGLSSLEPALFLSGRLI